MSGDRESRESVRRTEFVRRLAKTGRRPAPLPEGPDRTAELLQGNRVAREGAAIDWSPEKASKDMRRFAADLTGRDFI